MSRTKSKYTHMYMIIILNLYVFAFKGIAGLEPISTHLSVKNV